MTATCRILHKVCTAEGDILEQEEEEEEDDDSSQEDRDDNSDVHSDAYIRPWLL